jgi:hypothetical protein
MGAVGLSWVLAWAGGAIGIARTDDWAYLIIARTLHHSGHIHLIGFGQMTLVGLAVWAQPFLWVFGDHRWVLDLASSVLFALGVYGGHRLARTLLRPSHAAFVVLSVVAFPGVLRDASSFMTDGPALGLHVLVLVAGVACFRAAGSRRTAWIVVVGVLGLFAFSVRELTLAAPVAVLVTVMWSSRDLRRRAAVVLGAMFAACAVLWAWRHSLPGGEPYAGPPTAVVAALKLVGSVLAVGLGLTPVLALTWRRWWHPRRVIARAVGAATGVAIVLVPVVVQRVRHQHLWWLVGDYIQANGINGDKLVGGHRPLVLPRFWWDALVAVAVVGTVVLVMLLVEWAVGAHTTRGDVVAASGVESTSIRRVDRQVSPTAGGPIEALVVRMLLLHDLAYGVLLLVAGLGNGNVFDRYLWPLLLSAAIVVAHRFAPDVACPTGEMLVPTSETMGLPVEAPMAPWSAPAGPDARQARRRPVPVLASVVLVGIGATGLLLTANSDAFDGARWRAANEAVSRGAAPGDVDAGFEWIGTYRPNRHCIWIVSSPISAPGLHEIATSSWRPFLVGPLSRLHVYRADLPDCPLIG